MKYTPRYFSCEKLLRAVGFVPCEKSIDRGFEIKFRGKRRLHAFIHHGYIDIHWDSQKHHVSRTCGQVYDVERKIRRLDTRRVYWKVKFLKLKRKIYDKTKTL